MTSVEIQTTTQTVEVTPVVNEVALSLQRSTVTIEDLANNVCEVSVVSPTIDIQQSVNTLELTIAPNTVEIRGGIQGPKGDTGDPGDLSAQYVAEPVILTATDITNKSITLSQTPTGAAFVTLWVIQGGPQSQTVGDYSVSGAVIDWTGGPLDVGGASELVVGDELLIIYVVDP